MSEIRRKHAKLAEIQESRADRSGRVIARGSNFFANTHPLTKGPRYLT
jgi:hypothetical protein